MAIKDELLALKRDDGLIIAEDAVDWARNNPGSGLHKALPWNDAEAAHQYRLQCIRRLIAIHVVSEGGERQVVSLTIDRIKPAGGYRVLNEVLPVKSLRDKLIEDALADLDRVQKKYERLHELTEIWAAKETVRGRRRRAIETPAQVSA